MSQFFFPPLFPSFFLSTASSDGCCPTPCGGESHRQRWRKRRQWRRPPTQANGIRFSHFPPPLLHGLNFKQTERERERERDKSRQEWKSLFLSPSLSGDSIIISACDRKQTFLEGNSRMAGEGRKRERGSALTTLPAHIHTSTHRRETSSFPRRDSQN